MINWSELTLFLYIVARMSGFVLFNPILGRNNIPGAYRAGVILALSVSVASALVQKQTAVLPIGVLDLSIRILMEMFLGLLLGMAMNFFFYIPQLVGSTIDMQMGMTMNQIYDPGSQANLSVTGVLINTLMTMLFFAANGHHTMLRIMMTSGDVVGYGAVSLGDHVWSALLELFITCTIMAIKLTLPILAAELLGQVGMGILMKVIPQINVFAINIELKVIIGLGLLLALLSPISEYLLDVEMEMLKSFEMILGLAAG